jgi:predicted AlkP superfamily pyrophosphatase or phosphodiesterase
MRTMQRAGLCLLAAFSTLIAASPEPAKKPKLVVAIVIDQFRYDYLLRFGADYHYGLARLMQQGAVFTDAHYLQATTVTAVGHSTFLSGAPPSASGIIANEWYDRPSKQTVTSVFDPKTKLVGGIPGLPGSSPHRLMVSTVGDELKIRGGGTSKVIGVSIKDRSAILPAGHMADGAYWYDGDTNHWVTSTFYKNDLPDWVAKVNDEKAYQAHIGEQWLPLDAKAGAKPFCTMVAGTSARFCGGLEATPWGNEMIEAFSERAIAAENLGHHDGVDLLAVSFSSNDYVGHAVGPDDPAVRDISIRTDRLLGKLLDYVNDNVGAENVLVVLTADHGVAPVPEVNQARHMPGGRLFDVGVLNTMTNALTKRYGAGKWFLPSPAAMPYLNLETVQAKKLDLAEVERVAADAALTEPHIARAYTSHDLESGRVQQDPLGRAISLGYYGSRSGSLFLLPEPYYLFDATGTSHGTPYGYDTHVPVIFMGPQVKAGTYSEPIAVNDIATTLSAMLGLEPPSGSIGHVLGMMMK